MNPPPLSVKLPPLAAPRPSVVVGGKWLCYLFTVSERIPFPQRREAIQRGAAAALASHSLFTAAHSPRLNAGF